MANCVVSWLLAWDFILARSPRATEVDQVVGVVVFAVLNSSRPPLWLLSGPVGVFKCRVVRVLAWLLLLTLGTSLNLLNSQVWTLGLVLKVRF